MEYLYNTFVVMPLVTRIYEFLSGSTFSNFHCLWTRQVLPTNPDWKPSNGVSQVSKTRSLAFCPTCLERSEKKQLKWNINFGLLIDLKWCRALFKKKVLSSIDLFGSFVPFYFLYLWVRKHGQQQDKDIDAGHFFWKHVPLDFWCWEYGNSAEVSISTW